MSSGDDQNNNNQSNQNNSNQDRDPNHIEVGRITPVQRPLTPEEQARLQAENLQQSGQGDNLDWPLEAQRVSLDDPLL